MNIRKKIRIFFEILFGMPKSIYICFKYLPMHEAIHLPILVSFFCKCIELDGEISIKSDIKPGMILIGIGSVGFIPKRSTPSILELGKNSNVVFYGKARLGNGTKISSNGLLEFGRDFVLTGDSLILCKKHIKFGNENLVSWKVEIMDTDEHKIFYQEECVNPDEDVVFEEKVWIASGCKILKGVTIQEGCVIAANSVVTRDSAETYTIYAGDPARVVKREVRWER